MLTNKQLQKTLDELDWLKKYYKEHFAVEKKLVSKEYDHKLRSEMRAVVERINSDVDKATDPIRFINGKNRYWNTRWNCDFLIIRPKISARIPDPK